MSEYYIYLKCKPWVRAWLHHCWGDPVRFSNKSLEHDEIRHWLQPLPSGTMPKMREDDDVAIVIPQSQRKRPDVYNYLSKTAKRALTNMINFSRNFKQAVVRSCRNGIQIKYAVIMWMESNGIPMDHYETLLQQINRMVMANKKKGIDIMQRNVDGTYPKKMS